MTIGVIRVGRMAGERMEVLRRLEEERTVDRVVEWLVREEDLIRPELHDITHQLTAELSVLFIAVPGIYAYHLATKSLRFGLDTFLGRSAVPSIADCKALAALAEEAGVELGISRITRFHSFLDAIPRDWRASSLAVLHESESQDQFAFQQMIEDAVDLCCNLAGMGEVRKIESQLVQRNRAQPGSLMLGFRFQNGTYAQIQLRQGIEQPRYSLYAGGGSFELDVDLNEHTLRVRSSSDYENDIPRIAFESKPLPKTNLIERETRAFLYNLANNQPVPVSIEDGLQTLQLVEKVREGLR